MYCILHCTIPCSVNNIVMNMNIYHAYVYRYYTNFIKTYDVLPECSQMVLLTIIMLPGILY